MGLIELKSQQLDLKELAKITPQVTAFELSGIDAESLLHHFDSSQPASKVELTAVGGVIALMTMDQLLEAITLNAGLLTGLDAAVEQNTTPPCDQNGKKHTDSIGQHFVCVIKPNGKYQWERTGQTSTYVTQNGTSLPGYTEVLSGGAAVVVLLLVLLAAVALCFNPVGKAGG
jgi:hypothetical protein